MDSESTNKNYVLYTSSPRSCPYAQRVWIALNYFGVDYDIVDIDLWDKPYWFEELYEIAEGKKESDNKRSKVPLLKYNDKVIAESDYIVKFLDENLSGDKKLIPRDDQKKKMAFEFIEWFFNNIGLVMFKLLGQPKGQRQEEMKASLSDSFGIMNQKMRDIFTFPFFCGINLSIVEIMCYPWMERISIVLKHFRQFEIPEHFIQVHEWYNNMQKCSIISATSLDQNVLLSAYHKYVPK